MIAQLAADLTDGHIIKAVVIQHFASNIHAGITLQIRNTVVFMIGPGNLALRVNSQKDTWNQKYERYIKIHLITSLFFYIGTVKPIADLHLCTIEVGVNRHCFFTCRLDRQ